MKKKHLHTKAAKNNTPVPTGTFESQLVQAYIMNYMISPIDGPSMVEEDLAILQKFLLSETATGQS